MSKERTVFWIFLAANALWMVVPFVAAIKSRTSAVSWIQIIDLIGGKSAWPALWNVAIVCIPVQRVSPVLGAMGITTQQATDFHIWAANAALLWLSVHTVLLSFIYAQSTNYSLKDWLSLMLPYKMYYTEGVVNFMGWVGFLCFIGLWGFSRPFIRNKFYEVFKVLHWIFAALFLLGSNLHDYNTFFFIQPSVVLMVADFMLRRHSKLESSSSLTPLSSANAGMEKEGTVAVSSSKTGTLASLTFPIPNSWSQSIQNEPGLHVYLTVPTISKWQSHAYSISKLDPKEGTFSIHVKALGGWSKSLVSSIHDDCQNNETLSFEIEGPYASPILHQTIRSYKHCIFLAGGVGITGVVALAKARCRDLQNDGEDEEDGSGSTTSLLWMVQTTDEAKFLLPLLHEDNPSGNPPNNLCTHVWITQENPRDSDNDDENTFLEVLDPEEGGQQYSLYGRINLRVRWGSNFQWNTGIVVGASLLSSLLATMVSRWICTLQPAIDENVPYRIRECTFLWKSTKCRSCEIEDTFDLEKEYPCCTTPVCQYCFRGVPMILLFLGMPFLTMLMVRLFHGIYLRTCAGTKFWGYSTVENYDNTLEHDTIDNDSEGDDDLELDEITDIGLSEGQLASTQTMKRGSIEFHREKRPKSTAELLSDRYLPDGLVLEGTANPQDVLVVICGPSKLIESVKKELSNDLFRKHWRVVVAS